MRCSNSGKRRGYCMHGSVEWGWQCWNTATTRDCEHGCHQHRPIHCIICVLSWLIKRIWM